MKNATYLTQQHPGKESPFWTKCINEYLTKVHPRLPISSPIANPNPKGPWYRRRTLRPSIEFGPLSLCCQEPTRDKFLPQIESAFGKNLAADPNIRTQAGDVSGIQPDIFVMFPDRAGVVLMESKPYDGSIFDGNQGADGAYCRFVKAMNALGVPTQYLLICSISWKPYDKIVQLHGALEESFGVLLLEDVFANMGKDEFKYCDLTNWGEYSEKGGDYEH